MPCRCVGAMLIVLCLSVLGPGRARAETGTAAPKAQGAFLSLQQAIETALTTHPLVQEAAATLRASMARTEQSKSLYYPHIYANADTTAGAGRVNPRFLIGGGLLQPNLSQYTAGVIASQRLYDFGFTNALVESSEFAGRAQEHDLSARQALVLLDVQRSYFRSLKQRRLVQIAEDTVRERGVIRAQVASLYRNQLKSKLDLDLVQVELTNAESQLVKARNDLKASYADLNRAMGVEGRDDYVLEDLPIEVRAHGPLDDLVAESLGHPDVQRVQQLALSADSRAKAAKKQYLPTLSAIASAGDYEVYDRERNVSTGGWWTAGAVLSMPLFTGFLIENQVREAVADKDAAIAAKTTIEQTLKQQVITAHLETLTLAEQIKLAQEQVMTAEEALELARQRYKLALGSVVEVTQSEVAVTAAKTRLAQAQYDYKIAEATLSYVTGRNLRAGPR
ncbi:TolC family protein [Candidatus Nitrospira bockiana]